MRHLALAAWVLSAGCGEEAPAGAERAIVLQDLVLSGVEPSLVLPGTQLWVTGSFPAVVEQFELELNGDLAAPLSLRVPLTREAGGALVGSWPDGIALGQGVITARVVGVDAVDGRAHRSGPLQIELESLSELIPSLQGVQSGVAFVNDVIQLTGSGFLLGGGEGTTSAVVSGCFTPSGEQVCVPVESRSLLASPLEPRDRSQLGFVFAPRITGIAPGQFSGEVQLENHAAGGTVTQSEALSLELQLIAPRVFGLEPIAGSLGQKVVVVGGGFVGASEDDQTPAVTQLRIAGDFVSDGGLRIPVSFELVPNFSSGSRLVYVINEEDALGTSADLRRTQGVLEGSVTPIVSYGDSNLTGEPEPVTLTLLPVKQVVYVRFLPSYVQSLRHFGLRAVDAGIRARAIEVASELFRGVNLAFTESEPTDFALYTLVEIGGADPNGLGLLGYDNTPGKDVDNVRLDDRVGGLNALTQENGDPGYGGVFVESLFGFSEHPGGFAQSSAAASPLFDMLFDPFRPDIGKRPVLATESVVVELPDPGVCSGAVARPERIACAVRALGSLIGDTLAHELGHALGLAVPYGEAFHNAGDAPGRLMDGGSSRDFRERARLPGSARVMFCKENYDYLRAVLPSADPDPESERMACD